jgi:hypothetical protein
MPLFLYTFDNMKRLLLFFCILVILPFSSVSWSQISFVPRVDTLKFFDRMGGALSEMDLSQMNGASLLPGDGFQNPYQYLSGSWMIKNPTLQTQNYGQLDDKYVYSSLPHIGFFYSFGAQGSQNLRTNYSQAFAKKSLLNINLNRSSLNGFVLNSIYNKSDLTFNFLKPNGFYQTQVKGAYNTVNHNLYGGVRDEEVYETLGPNFAAVNKSNAKSIWSSAIVNWESRFNFTSDSALVKTGLALFSDFQLGNRVYTEQDSLNALYSQINIDSLSTRDQFQENGFSNGAGYFFNTKKIDFSAFALHRYRRLQNLGGNSDTNELGLRGQLTYSESRWRLEGKAYQNLQGAKGEHSLSLKFIGDLSKLTWSANASYENLLPNMQQRTYFSNHSNYSTPLNLQKRFFAHGRIEAEVLSWLDLELKSGIDIRDGYLFWENDRWTTNAYLNSSFVFGAASAHLFWKNLGLKPFVDFSVGKSELPSNVFGGRFYATKKMFKAKKLEGLVAIDFVQVGAYRLMSYVPLMDTYQASISNPLSKPRQDLHLTISFGIEEFRFFVRAENLNRIGQSKIDGVALGYFVTPFMLRIGITWDFFN